MHHMDHFASPRAGVSCLPPWLDDRAPLERSFQLSITLERNHLGQSSSRLPTRICQNVGGNSRWDGERRAPPVSSLPYPSLDPFVSNIVPAALMLIFTTRQDPSVLVFARDTNTSDIPSFAIDFLMRRSNRTPVAQRGRVGDVARMPSLR
jgi:hypothetical protein